MGLDFEGLSRWVFKVGVLKIRIGIWGRGDSAKRVDPFIMGPDAGV